MSQEAVERLLGRLITDKRFRTLAATSLEAACLQEGYPLTPGELQMLSRLERKHFAELAGQVDSGLCRACPNELSYKE